MLKKGLIQSNLKSLKLISRGKVRDIYSIDNDYLLLVATDRLSAFDVVLPDPVPGKGEILTKMSVFWFKRLGSNLLTQLTDISPESVVPPNEYDEVRGRSLIVKRIRPLPIEAIVRGYLAGSGFKEYQENGSICDIPLPPGLKIADALPEPIFTPSTKPSDNSHDENISFEKMKDIIGKNHAEEIRETSLTLYRHANEHAAKRGILIADTKFEFGIDSQGNLCWIDEALTPDSSRFWPKDKWQAGKNPPSFDKQFVRDYLETIKWSKVPPGPHLPEEIIQKTADKYQEAFRRLTEPPNSC
ncbi:MAG: phosphoribosylaminoimidazolesuccinocarboxamide synthase [Proteobacteria bacterium]|nr:phosphoribosylaminoimidazolesuccinocarboxamide synthase [Pseudomonadota bacterium]MDE3207594.1 phosphoribosylaminoimidazolesuccinocarboxamide synthase [Pseudomonadota bacterium]